MICSPSCRSSRAAGFTLVELVLAAAISVILLGAMTSALVITARALDHGDSPTRRVDDAAEASRRIVSELKLAISFSELTANAATFTVPDRDGDEAVDTIRYAWSGTPGDPLTVSYNGQAAVVVVADVHHFNLPDLSTVVAGSGGAVTAGEESANLRILMVVDEADALDAQDLARKFLLQAWGHQVSFISQSEPLSVFNGEIANHDVLYIPTNTREGDLKTKVRGLAIPAVVENYKLARWFGLTDSAAGLNSGGALNIVNDAHYITRLFQLSGIALFTEDLDVSDYENGIG
ncbi:MAG: prepilin-type N-terminal cleavage/methylation domain-containing protein, partial [Phycisphaerae bacterium]|nr:prepilin-type N-terminal cleavage/methylation domain-containing protein [Phycisphaerae bacterium]